VAEMKYLLKSDGVTFDESKITVTAKNRSVTVKGPRGTLTKNFRHLDVDINVMGDKVKVDCWFASRKAASLVKTVCAHISNLMMGVTRGFEYHLKVVYAHFPVNTMVTADKRAVEIRNFLGEKRVRRINMLEASKDELILAGNDLELVSLSAALISQSCTVRNKDIRKFLDGIYVSEKGHVEAEEELEEEA
jgi:large subunit ribosomal protein L9e